MLGNCATGRARMVSEPTSTNKIEMTMATMGRLMKNFDMALLSLRHRSVRFGIYGGAGTHFLNAFGNDFVSGFQSIRYDPVAADAVGNCDRADDDFVVRAHHANLVTTLEFGDR